VIDSTFYGVLLHNAPYGSPTPWFHGQVIDMIFVDFWEGFIPEWVPVWGGQYYSTPIFNIADSCIFIGVCSILVFQGSFHSATHPEDETPETSEASLAPTELPQDEFNTEKHRDTEISTLPTSEELEDDENKKES
jgi:signal peptidase II